MKPRGVVKAPVEASRANADPYAEVDLPPDVAKWLRQEKYKIGQYQRPNRFSKFKAMFSKVKLDAENLLLIKEHQQQILAELDNDELPLPGIRVTLFSLQLHYLFQSNVRLDDILGFFEAKSTSLLPTHLFLAIPSDRLFEPAAIDPILLMIFGYLQLAHFITRDCKKLSERPSQFEVFMRNVHALRAKFALHLDALFPSNSIFMDFDDAISSYFGVDIEARPLQVEKTIRELEQYVADPKSTAPTGIEQALIFSCRPIFLNNKNSSKRGKEKSEGDAEESEGLPENFDELSAFAVAFLGFLERFWRKHFTTEADVSKMQNSLVIEILDLAAAAMAIHDPNWNEATSAALANLKELFVSLNGLCAQCQKSAKTKCGKCLLFRYCSAECQRANWKEHKKLCGHRTLEQIKLELCLNPPWRKST